MARRVKKCLKRGAGGKCLRRAKSRRGFRGYGSPVKVYSGFGKLNIGLDALVPPVVGGGVAGGVALALRYFVKPVKETNGQIEMDADGNPKIHWAFKYAGLIGAGAGALVSLGLGPFLGWGGATNSAISSVLVGGASQLYNMAVKKDYQSYRGYGRLGMIAMQQRLYGGGNANGMAGYGRSPVRSPMYARNYRGYGAIGAIPTQRRFALPGRGAQSIPPEVLASINPGAFGTRGATLGTNI